jgi:hypothetical protein
MLDDAVPFVITFWVTRHTSVSEPIVSLPESILQVEPFAALVPVNSYESAPFEYVPAGGSNTTPRLNGTLGSWIHSAFVGVVGDGAAAVLEFCVGVGCALVRGTVRTVRSLEMAVLSFSETLTRHSP